MACVVVEFAGLFNDSDSLALCKGRIFYPTIQELLTDIMGVYLYNLIARFGCLLGEAWI